MPHVEAREIGLKSLRWLCDIQTAPAGHFRPIGSNGFNVQGGHRSQFDQQPIEAHATLSACLEAYRATKDFAWSVERLSRIKRPRCHRPINASKIAPLNIGVPKHEC